jgi:hypothetical protein
MFQLRKTTFHLADKIKWQTFHCHIHPQTASFKKAQTQAELKAAQTMNAAQDGRSRDAATKYQKQLMGILAEMACVAYLQKWIIDNQLQQQWQVVRYDDVRIDQFKNPAGEFDIRLINTSTQQIFNIESRSSICYDRSIQEALQQYDIIGPYSSVAKQKEKLNDFYLRPLFQYKNFEQTKYEVLDFEKLFIAQAIELYIVAGCTKEDMQTKGKLKSMKQGATSYLALPILKSIDAVGFEAILFDSLRLFWVFL